MPLPNWTNSNRRVMRAPINPLDKSTIVSIYPRVVLAEKPTIQPSNYSVPAGTREKPAILVVGPASWWREVEENNTLEIPTSSVAVADSIIKDYSVGLLGCQMGHAQPGLFVLPGEFTVEKIIKDYVGLLEVAVSRQRNWYSSLVTMADAFWAASNGNPRSIGDDMRLAATELNLTDKPWLRDFEKSKLTNCPACGNLRDERFPVCPNCKTIIDKIAYGKLGMGIAV